MTTDKTQSLAIPAHDPEDAPKPPLPKFMYGVINPLMKLILRSPLHGKISERLMLLTFTGRKSGKRFTTPVGYLREDNHVYIFTNSPWWKNLRGAPVTMCIQGKDLRGWAEIVQDHETILHMVNTIIAKDGEEMAARMGFRLDKPDPTPEELRQATQGRVFIRIRINEAK